MVRLRIVWSRGVGGKPHWVSPGWLDKLKEQHSTLPGHSGVPPSSHRSASAVTTLDKFVFFGWILTCWESRFDGPGQEANCLAGWIHIQQSWGASPAWIDHFLPAANRSTLSPEVTCGGTGWYQIRAALRAASWTEEAKPDRRTPRSHVRAEKPPTSLSAHVICFLYGCQKTANASV